MPKSISDLRLNLFHERWFSGVVLATLLIGLYLVLAIYDLDQPGLYYDEAFQIPSAVRLVHGEINGQSATTLGRYHITLFNTPLPLMHLEYLGAVKAYLFLPAFFLFGISTITVRATTILIGALALAFTYLFLKEAFSQRIGVLCTILLSTDASYIVATRLDWGPISIMMLCKMASLFFLIRWWRTACRGYLMLGTFFLGIGFWDKANFIWFMLALLISAVLFNWRQMFQRISLGDFGYSLACFLMGSSGLVIYNIAYPGVTFLPQINAISAFWDGQTTSLNPLESIITRLNVLIGVLKGIAIPQFVLGDVFSSGQWIVVSVLPYALLVSVLVLILFYVISRQWPEKKVLFIILMSIIILVQIFITVKAGGPHHAMMIYPFPHVLVALALEKILSLRSLFKSAYPHFRSWIATSVAIVLLGVVISNITVIVTFYSLLIRTGASGMWSDSIYNLADYLKGERRTIVSMDWGFNNQLIVLSQGNLRTSEPIWALDWEANQYRESAKEWFKRALLRSDASKCCLFLFHSQEFTSFKNPSLIFFRSVQELHWEAAPVKTFYQRDGRLIYTLYQILQREQ